MHVIVSCSQCDRQYDTIGRAPGEQFRCICGEMNAVPDPGKHEARVVRCSACGGVRQGEATNCSFCSSDFTIHEKDLNTVCAKCLTRISDRSRFCHHCATPVQVVGNAGSATELDCPGCRELCHLTVRQLETNQVTALECTRCAGLWLDNSLFSALERQMLELASSGVDGAHKTVTEFLPAVPITDQNLYRKCPICAVMMHRRNYGPGSGVVMDHCRKHGFWFDNQELSVILRWIRTGGLLASNKRRLAMEKDRERVARLLEKLENNRKRYEGSRPESLFDRLGIGKLL